MKNTIVRKSQIANVQSYESSAFEPWAGSVLGSFGTPLSIVPCQAFSLAGYLSSDCGANGWIMCFDFRSVFVDGAWTTPSGLGCITPMLVEPGGNSDYWDFKQYRKMTSGLFVAVSSTGNGFTPWNTENGPGAMFVVDFLTPQGPS